MSIPNTKAVLGLLIYTLLSSSSSSSGLLLQGHDGHRRRGIDALAGAGASTAMVHRLRGGGVLSGFDQQLQDEILNDIKRQEQGKLPLFIEQLGQEEQTGAFKYGVGVEAAMPPVIGETADAAMEDAADSVGDVRTGDVQAAVAATSDEQRAALEAAQAAEARAWFAEKDKTYFNNDEYDDEPILGHTGIPQKREMIPDEPLQKYLELRRDCPELSRFMRTLPHNNSLIPQALDDYGWHEGMLRNGTRIKWCVSLSGVRVLCAPVCLCRVDTRAHNTNLFNELTRTRVHMHVHAQRRYMHTCVHAYMYTMYHMYIFLRTRTHSHSHTHTHRLQP